MRHAILILTALSLSAVPAVAAAQSGPEQVLTGTQEALPPAAQAAVDRALFDARYERGVRTETGLTVAGAAAMVAGAALTVIGIVDWADQGIFPCGLNLFGEETAEDRACHRSAAARSDRNAALIGVGIPTLVGGTVLVTVGQTVNFGHKDGPARSAAARQPSVTVGYQGAF